VAIYTVSTVFATAITSQVALAPNQIGLQQLRLYITSPVLANITPHGDSGDTDGELEAMVWCDPGLQRCVVCGGPTRAHTDGTGTLVLLESS